MVARLPWPVLALTVLSTLPGCAHRGESSPRQVLSRYLQALTRDDPATAYRLLDPPTREHLPYDTFLAEWRTMGGERMAQAQALRRQQGRPLPLEAILSLSGGARVALRQVPSGRPGWFLSDPDLSAVRPQTPEEAAQLLLAAAERHSYDAVLRLLTPAQRQALQAEVRERIEHLRAALLHRQPAEVQGDRARYQYDPRFYIEMRREQDAWWVVDLN